MKMKLHPLALAVAALGFTSLPQIASAQDTVEEIVVTGMRGSLESSVQIKRETMEIVDSITAEDIGKLPDPNVAETLTRIPGVQGYRYGGEGASPVGEGSGLTIRGLSGQTASRVDGRAYFTAGGREFNIESAIPGMVAGIDVYKNPSAEHIEGGIGGLVNIRTRKPLDFDGRKASVALSGRYNEMSDETSPEIFGLFSDRWETGIGEIGVLIAGNYQESHNRSDSDSIFGRGPNIRRAVRADSDEYATLAGANLSYAGRSDIWHLADVACPDGTGYEANPSCLPLSDRQNLITTLSQTKQIFQEDIQRERRGANVTVQWRPNDTLDLYATGNYNYYEYEQEYRFMVFNDSRTVQGLGTVDYNFDENFMNRNLNGGGNELVAGQRLANGTFVDSSLEIWGGHESSPYKTWLAAVGGNWQASDKLLVKFDLSTIKATRDQDNRRVDLVPRTGLTWDVTRQLISEPHQLAIAGPALNDASNFVFRDYHNGTHQGWDDNGVAMQVDFVYELDSPVLKKLKFGTRYANQESNYSSYNYGGVALTTDGNPLAADQSNAIAANSLSSYLETAPNNWLDKKAGYGGGYIVFKPTNLQGNSVRNLFPASAIPENGQIPENVLARRYTDESSLAGYLVADFAHGETFEGNIGVRLIETDVSARAMMRNQNGDIVPNSDKASYFDAIPSFNLTTYLNQDRDFLLRFGYAKGISRPALAALNPAINVDVGNGTGSRGNPNLKPLKADSFDVSVEKYFSKSNYASLSVFYKDIDGFFNGVSACEAVPGFPVYNGPDNGCAANQYVISRTENAEKGSAQGVEAAFQTFFDYDFMPAAFHNFGMMASYAYLETENPVNFGGQIVNTPMPFQSKNSWTLAGMYEDNFLSARVVYTYRSDFVLFGVDAWPSWGRYVEGHGVLDASVSMNVTDQLVLSFNASNITNDAPHRFVGEPGGYASDFSVQHYKTGRVFGAGLRYNF